MKKASALSNSRLILTVFCLVFCVFTQINAQSPGGFGSGLSFWLKADGTVFQNVNGTGAVSNGSNVGSWRDQAASILLQSSAGEPTPIFRTDVSSAINFNPVVDFQGSHLANTTGVGAWTMFIVSQPDATNPLAPVISTPCSGNTCATRQVRVETATNWYCCDSGDFGNIETLGFGTDGATGFTTAHLAFLQAGDLYVLFNGIQMGDTVTYPGENHRLWGRVAEVVVYNDILSAGNREKVQTYLALKYGLALNQNYTASNGTTIWSLAGNTGYNNRITGVGRDDNSGLLQKQSTSTINDELTVGIGNIASTNQLNSANPSNLKFMLWGHNDQNIYTRTLLNTPVGAITHRSDKVYKISNNGLTDQVKMRFDLPLLDCVNPAECKLLISSDPDFTNPTVVNLQSNTATSLTFQTAAVANGSYVAIGYAVTPEVPVITGNTQICSVNGSTTLTATGNLHAADNWYWSMTDCDGPSIGTGPTLTVTAPGVYYAHGGNSNPGCFLFGPCASVTVTAFDPAPTATANSAECPGQTIQLFGSGTSIVNWSWTGPAGFASSQQNPSIPNATTANSGDYQLIVTDIHGCTASASVNVHIYAAPFVDAGPDQVLCNQTSTQMAAGTFGTWSIVSGTATIVDPFDPNTQITGLIPGTSVTLRLTVVSDPCTAHDDVTIFNNLNANSASAGPDQTLCNATSTTLQGNSPGAGTGVWTLVSGTANIVSPSSPTTQVTGLQAGIVVMRWTITPSNGCPVSFDEVQLTVGNPNPVITSNSPLCVGAQLQMGATGNSISAYLWEGPNSFASFDQSFVLDNVTSANAGAYTVTVTDIYGCTKSAVSTVIINALPVANAGADQVLCNQVSTNMAATAANGTGVWTKISGPGTIVTPGAPNTLVTGLVPGSGTILRWTVSGPGGVCAPVFDEVQINVGNPNPVITSNSPLCVGAQLQMSATGNSINSYLWDGPDNFASFDASFVIDNVTTINAGAYTVTVTDIYGCTQSAVSTVVINAVTASDAGADKVLCNLFSTNMAATAVNGTGVWTKISGPGTIVSPGSPNTLVTGLVPGSNTTLRWTVSGPGGACPVFDEVVIFDGIPPAPANAGPDQLLCTQFNTVVSANAPGNGTGLWTLVSGAANIIPAGAPTAEVLDLQTGITILRWTITPDNGCPATQDELQITVRDPQPTVTSSAPLCVGDNLLMIVSANEPGTYQWSGPNGFNSSQDIVSISPTTLANAGAYTVTVTDVAGCSASTTVDVEIDPLPNANAGPDQALCNQTSTQILANDVQGEWSIVSGNATIANVNEPSTQVSGLIPGTTLVLRWTVNSVGATLCSAFDDMVITNGLAPTVADAGPDQGVCGTDATLAANMAAVGTGIWSVVSGTGNISNVNDPGASVSGLAPGANIFRWTISNGPDCPASMDEVTITVNGSLSAEAGPDQTICYATSTTLAATAALAGNTGTWSVVSGSGIFSSINDPAATFSAFAPGLNVLRWTITSNGNLCPQVADDVSITSVVSPGIPNAGADQTACSKMTTLAATPVSAGSGLWVLSSGNALIVEPSNPTTVVDNLIEGTTVTLVWQVSNTGCPVLADTMSIITQAVFANPMAGADQEQCYNTTTVLYAVAAPAGTTASWSVVAGSGNFTNPNDPNTAVSGLSAGVNVLRWTITDNTGTCPAVSDELNVNIIPSPGPVDAGSDQEICAGSTLVLGAQAPGTGTGFWSIASGDIQILAINDPNSQAIVNTAAVLLWNVSNGNCPALADTVALNLAGPPAPTDAGPDRSFCNPQEITMLAPDPPAGSSGQWTLISGAGTLADPVSPHSYVDGLGIGDNVFRWTITSPAGACQTVFDDVVLTLLEAPSLADAGPDQIFCGNKAQLAAIVPAIGMGSWTITSGNGTLSDPNAATAVLSDLVAGTDVVLEWSNSNGACPIVYSDQVLIQVLDPNALSPADAGVDQSVCYDNNTVLQASAPPYGTGVWSFVNGSGVFDSPNDPNSGISGLDYGLNVLQWTVTPASGCPALTDQVEIVAIPSPDPAQAGTDQTLCAAASTLLSGNTPVVGSGLWEILSGPGTLVNPASPTTQITGLIPGSNTLLQWKTVNGSCPFTPGDELLITNDLNPSNANAGIDIATCANATGLNATAPAIGTGQWSIVNGGGTLSDPAQPNSALNGLIPGTSTLVWTVSNGVCPAKKDSVNILSVNQLTADAGPDQALCNVASTILDATIPGAGSGLWSIVSGTGTLGNATANNSALNGLLNGVPLTLQWTVSLPTCPTVSDQVTITVSPLPSVANAGVDQTLCGVTDAVLGATPPLVGTGAWSIVSGTGNTTIPAAANSALTGMTLNNPVVLQWTVSSGTCPSSTDQVTITPKALPSPAVPGSGQSLCNAAQTTLSATVPAEGQGGWHIVDGNGTLADPTAANTLLTNLIPGTGSVIVRWTVAVDGCPENSAELTIQNDALPSTADAGTNTSVCFSDLNLSAVAPSVGSGIWTLLNGSITIQAPNQPNTLVSDLPQGSTAELAWTVSNGVCPSSADTIQISYYDGAFLNADFLINALACTGDSFHIVEISDSFLVADSYAWDFGDGNFSTERDPVHTYASAGDYPVRLTATLGPCSTTMEKTVTVANCLPSSSKGGRAFAYGQVQPNPSEGPFRLFLTMNHTDQPVEATLVNSIGTVIRQALWPAQETMEQDFAVDIPGMYFLRVRSGKEELVFKVVVVD